MKDDLSRAQTEGANLEATLTAVTEEKRQREDDILNMEKELKGLIDEYEVLRGDADRIQNQKRQESEVHKSLYEHGADLDRKLMGLEHNQKLSSDKKQKLGKELYDSKKRYKKVQNQKRQIENQLRDYLKQIEEEQKKQSNLEEDRQRQQEMRDKLSDEYNILAKKVLDEEGLEHDRSGRLEGVEKEIAEGDTKAQETREEEAQLQKKMQWLGVEREQMARKASMQVTQAREKNEELKIKKLLILDLTKKLQETEAMLKHYIILYEDAKNDRNKYVKLIQNSSQDLAETKERIKILQNEVEILRNESAEKDRALKEERHEVQKSRHERDKTRGEINKLDFVIKQKQSISQQQVQEIGKLNAIINTLEKEMIDLKHKHESACESRNYTGIQLIDRNDELCILYEKSNIQESVQKKGEKEIRAKEDEIRMLNLELAEVQRMIEVVRKQIPLMPTLANEVLSLKRELDEVKMEQKELSEKIQDPSNKERYRELPGEDPDQEALEAKIQVLEERLNNKKEELLEKELVLEEISNLAKNLREQALSGRQSTLELAERVNDFQARIKDLTRKMMATVSELSIFQVTAQKLQKEKEEYETIVESAYSRIEQGQPPTEDCETELERMMRDERMRAEERAERKQREAEEKEQPDMATKTTAMSRVHNYVPAGTAGQPSLGLPQPYTVFMPFVPSEAGATRRHFRKPNPPPIEF
jgi:chromosome segregation ATPase